jgi:hypothetical protein
LVKVQFSAVILRSSNEKARVYFVDNNSRIVFGKLSVKGSDKDLLIANFVDDLMQSVQVVYGDEQKISAVSGKGYPSVTTLLPKIKSLVEMKVEQSKI